MSALRGNQTPAEQNEAITANSSMMSYVNVAHDSMSQHADPYAYTELHNIVDNGHYLNLSRARAHFGIEPLTDTVSELLMLQEAYIELCYNIAVKM